jgi:pimeloyl-ACP methyl ester carboxylesterase
MTPQRTIAAKKDPDSPSSVSMLRLIGWLVLGPLVLGAAILASYRAAAALREAKSADAAAPKTGRFVQAGDVRVYIQETGPVTGSPVLFIHGTGAWSEIWRETMQALASRGYRAIALDVPPFGFSERPDDASYGDEAQARRILGVVDALGLAPVTLVGHSFGGRPTVQATFLAPEKVRALVLIDAALDLHMPPGSAEHAKPALERVLSIGPMRNALVAATITNPALSRRLLTMLIANDSAATPERIDMLQRPFIVNGTTSAVGAWLVPFLTVRERSATTERERYKGLTMPTLVLWGARDDLTPLAQGRELASLIPGAELSILGNAGHIPAIEDPAGVNAALVGFLERHAARR